ARYYLDRAMRRTEHLSADVLWTAIKIEHRAHNTDAEASLINRLRRLHPGSPEYASYLRGAFND
ncbi:MAG: type IV pilus biogenesis/stability protein PilW, partial [Herbaspirillum sp.]